MDHGPVHAVQSGIDLLLSYSAQRLFSIQALLGGRHPAGGASHEIPDPPKPPPLPSDSSNVGLVDMMSVASSLSMLLDSAQRMAVLSAQTEGKALRVAENLSAVEVQLEQSEENAVQLQQLGHAHQMLAAQANNLQAMLAMADPDAVVHALENDGAQRNPNWLADAFQAVLDERKQLRRQVAALQAKMTELEAGQASQQQQDARNSSSSDDDDDDDDERGGDDGTRDDTYLSAMSVLDRSIQSAASSRSARGRVLRLADLDGASHDADASHTSSQQQPSVHQALLRESEQAAKRHASRLSEQLEHVQQQLTLLRTQKHQAEAEARRAAAHEAGSKEALRLRNLEFQEQRRALTALRGDLDAATVAHADAKQAWMQREASLRQKLVQAQALADRHAAEIVAVTQQRDDALADLAACQASAREARQAVSAGLVQQDALRAEGKQVAALLDTAMQQLQAVKENEQPSPSSPPAEKPRLVDASVLTQASGIVVPSVVMTEQQRAMLGRISRETDHLLDQLDASRARCERAEASAVELRTRLADSEGRHREELRRLERQLSVQRNDAVQETLHRLREATDALEASKAQVRRAKDQRDAAVAEASAAAQARKQSEQLIANLRQEHATALAAADSAAQRERQRCEALAQQLAEASEREQRHAVSAAAASRDVEVLQQELQASRAAEQAAERCMQAAQEKHDNDMQKLEQQHAAALAAAQAAAQRAQRACEDEHVDAMQALARQHNAALQELRASASAQTREAAEQHAEDVAMVRNEWRVRLESQQDTAAEEAKAVASKHQRQLEELEATHLRQVADIKAEHQRQVDDVEAEHQRQLGFIKAEHERQVDDIKMEHQRQEEASRARIDELHAGIEQMQRTMLEQETSLAQLRNAFQQLEQQSEGMQQQFARQRSEWQAKVAAAARELQAKDAQLQQMQQVIADERAELRRKLAEVRDISLGALHKHETGMQQQVQQVQQAREHAESQLAQCQEQVREGKAALAAAKTERDEAREALVTLSTEHDAVRAQVRDLTAALAQAKTAASASMEERDALKQKLASVAQVRDAAQAEHSRLCAELAKLREQQQQQQASRKPRLVDVEAVAVDVAPAAVVSAGVQCSLQDNSSVDSRNDSQELAKLQAQRNEFGSRALDLERELHTARSEASMLAVDKASLAQRLDATQKQLRTLSNARVDSVAAVARDNAKPDALAEDEVARSRFRSLKEANAYLANELLALHEMLQSLLAQDAGDAGALDEDVEVILSDAQAAIEACAAAAEAPAVIAAVDTVSMLHQRVVALLRTSQRQARSAVMRALGMQQALLDAEERTIPMIEQRNLLQEQLAQQDAIIDSLIGQSDDAVRSGASLAPASAASD